MKWHPSYQRIIDKAKRNRQRSLVKLTIEVSRDEAAELMTIAKQAKLSRKRWLQKLVRKAVDKIRDTKGGDFD